MKIGKWNLVVGGFGLLIAAFGGIALGFTFDQYAVSESREHVLSLVRFYLREGHSHGMPMALLNLIFGLAIDRLELSDRFKRIGSIGALLAFVLPLSLFLKGAFGAPDDFPPIGLIGILGFLVAAITLGVGALRLPAGGKAAA